MTNPLDFDRLSKVKDVPEKTDSKEESPAKVKKLGREQKGRGSVSKPVSSSPSTPIWPDRTPRPAEDQVSIKGPAHIIERFKSLSKSDRRTYADMLEILMNRFDEK